MSNLQDRFLIAALVFAHHAQCAPTRLFAPPQITQRNTELFHSIRYNEY